MRESSYTRRLFPIPGTPTSVTSCGVRSWRARSNASRSTVSSRSRPTSSVRASCATSTPKRERAACACQTAIGSVFPFASTATAGACSIAPRVARYVVSSTRIPFTGAAAWRRAAVLTTSPEAIPSPASGRASSRISASPVVTAIRTCASSLPRAHSRIASAALTARSGSSSCATGAPKSAMTASPMNFSTVPPWCSSSERRRSW